MTRIEKLQARLKAEGLDALLINHVKNIRYLTGFTGSFGYAVVTPDNATLYIDPRYTQQARLQATTVTVTETIRDVLKDVLKEINALGSKRVGFEAARMTVAEFARVQDALPAVELVRTQNWVEQLRSAKDETEIAAIRRAVKIADDAYAEFLTWIKPGMTEREAAAQLELFQRRAGGDRKPTETVVASGPRSALPHGMASDRVIQPNEPVMIDIGIVIDGYTSDLTRTVYLGTPPAQFEEIYQVVLDAQAKAITGARPGMTGRQIDALARDHIREAGYGEYFGHALGHSIGLEIHEMPNFSLYEDSVIQPGAIVTVEPGIYLPGVFGVRTEDNILMTETGCEVLTQSPHDLKAL